MPKFVILPRCPDRLFELVGPCGDGQTMLLDFDTQDIKTVTNRELGHAQDFGDPDQETSLEIL